MTYVEPVDDNDIPISSSYVPNTGFVGVQGSSNVSTDTGGKTSTPVNVNLKQVGDVLFALGQALKAASIPVTLASDQGNVPISASSLPLPTGAATQTTLASVLAQLQAGIAVSTISNYATETGGNLAAAKADLDTIVTNTNKIPASPATEGGHLATIDTSTAASKTDLDTLAGIVSSNKAAVKAGAGDFADLSTLAGIVSSGKAATKAASGDFVAGAITDLATLLTLAGAPGDANTANSFQGRFTKIRDLLNALTDTFGTSTAISAATTFGTIPLVSALAVNSYATLPNSSYQGTFLVQINVASAFVGTIGFYGLLPDGTTLQQISAHQRGTATNGNSSAINTGSALEQTWEGSIAAFKAIYVVCTAFTSGAASVYVGLTAASYAHAIINTVAQNLTQVGGVAPQLDGGSSNRLGVSLYGKNASAGDTPFLLDLSGRLINISTIEDAIRNGKGYQATTGKIATATNPNLVGGMGLYNPSGSGKSILIYSIKFYLSAASTVNQVNLTTADPAMGNAVTPVNLKPGGGASAVTVSAPANNFTASVSVIGTLLDTIYALSSTPIEVLTNGACILLPSGANNGVAAYLTIATAAQSFAVAMKWIEF